MRNKAGIKIYDFNIDNGATNFFKIEREENYNIIYQNKPILLNNIKFKKIHGRLINYNYYGISITLNKSSHNVPYE